MRTIEMAYCYALVAATEPHLRATSDLLREASEAAPDASNRDRLASLAEHCEAVIHHFCRLASVLEAQELLLTHPRK
jgi:hypothetical protein